MKDFQQNYRLFILDISKRYNYLIYVVNNEYLERRMIMLKKFPGFILVAGLSLPVYGVQQSDILFEPHGDELITRVSDHKMVANRTNLHGEDCYFATYNSWARGTLNGFMHLPGYQNRIEPNVINRINTNIDQINNFLQKYPNSFIALQEWNPNDLATLKQKLKSGHALYSASTYGENFFSCADL